MESLPRFKETPDDVVAGVDQSPSSHKLVPWLSWDEWDTVRESLFSSSPNSISSALQRVTAWRSRGCLPVVIEITASLIEIQQRDTYFRGDIGKNGALESEEMLAMLYSMAIMRLVNGVVEKTRKKTEVSIGEAADVLNIPRMLIDIRHEGSHRNLPSVRLVRVASIKALDWLKSYYWEPQKKAIQFQSDGATSIRKAIKSKLCELAFCSKNKLVTGSSSPAKRKWTNPCESFCGRNKFLSLTAGKPESSKLAGSKKQVRKVLKNLVRLYSSYSSEVVSVLVELLLKGSASLDFIELYNCVDEHSTDLTQSAFDDWKPVITKLSNKEPGLLLTLIKAVYEMIETQEAIKCENGEFVTLEGTAEASRIDRLLNLFAWLVGILRGLKPVCRNESSGVKGGYSIDTSLPKPTLVELLHKSLLVSCPGNNQLKSSALVLARMIGNNTLVEKLNKLLILSASNPEFDEENSFFVSSEAIFAQQEDSIHQATKKLELVKLCRMKSKATDRVSVANEKRWVVAKKWNKCPIGMLPGGGASSGRLPVLDCDEDHNQVLKPSENQRHSLVNKSTHKRKPDCEVELLNGSSCKKTREIENINQNDEEDDTSSHGVQGKLMIGGVWKKVEEQELLAIAAGVRILV